MRQRDWRVSGTCLQLPETQVQFQYLLELTAMTGTIRPTVSVSGGAYIYIYARSHGSWKSRRGGAWGGSHTPPALATCQSHTTCLGNLSVTHTTCLGNLSATHHLLWQPVSLDSITIDKHKQNKYAYKNKVEVSKDCLVLHCRCLLFLVTLGPQVKLLKRSRKHSLDTARKTSTVGQTFSHTNHHNHVTCHTTLCSKIKSRRQKNNHNSPP